MAIQLKLKRRNTGLAGGPSALINGELAMNEADDTLYYGKGADGGGNATSILALAGPGAFITLGTNQNNITGNKTFSGQVVLGASATATTPATNDNSTAVATTAYVKAQPIASSTLSYLTISNDTASLTNSRRLVGTSGRVTVTDGGPAGSVVIDLGVSGIVGSTYTKLTIDSYGRATAGTTLVDSDIPVSIARLNDPAFTGTPTAPTAVSTTNSTQLATTAFVKTAIDNLISGSPGVLDTLNEIATALGNDPNFATTITNSIATKLTASSNLSDLTNAGTARSNLGLVIGTHVQAHSAKITSLAGVTLAANTGIIGTGTNTFGTYTLSTYALSLLDDANASTARTTLELGTIATQNANNVTITGGSIDGIILDGGTF